MGILIMLIGLSACTSVNTFPMVARAGDTVSVMVGGSEKARKENIAVTLEDVNGQQWNLKSLGLVRSLFNLRLDGRAEGMHYSSNLDISWVFGHEPVQTVLVADLPAGTAPGAAKLIISLNAGGDNSSGISDPYTVNLEIIPGSGSTDTFLRKNYIGNPIPANLGQMEPAPHAKISFAGISSIGAASLKIGFNGAVLNGSDINLYVPESTVKVNSAFGNTQRMVYWRQDGQNLYVDIVAPQGINGKYLQVFVICPRGLGGSPGFTLTDAKVYGIDGELLSAVPTLAYFP